MDRMRIVFSHCWLAEGGFRPAPILETWRRDFIPCTVK
jgi:hypothetical protein